MILNPGHSRSLLVSPLHQPKSLVKMRITNPSNLPKVPMNVQLQEEPKWVRLCRILKKKNLTYSIMIPMDRETLMMVATIVAIAGVIFLFREMNKAKQDVDNLKNFSAHVVQRLSAPEPEPVPAPVAEKKEVDTEEKKEE